MDRRSLLIGMLLVGMAQAVGPVRADGGNNSGNGDGDDDGDEVWNQAAEAAGRGEIAALPDILKIALANTPGKVIAVRLDHHGSSFVYRVKILADTGRKVELSIDARLRIVTKVR